MLNNQDFYIKAYKKHGISAQGVNWNSKKSQELRFEVLSDLLGTEVLSARIVDAGCGFGELYAYWRAKKIFPKHYVGLDCVQNSIDIANERFEGLDVSFTCRDVLKDKLPMADWYVCSGALNILSPFDTWLFLENILKNSKKGIIFNILKGYKKSKNFNYMTKEDIADFAKGKGLEYFIVEGYMKDDMTVRILTSKS
jgi:SAM-dependent methyltransferase